MPVFNYYSEKPPLESEVQKIDVFHLRENEVLVIKEHQKKEMLLVAAGRVQVKTNKNLVELEKFDVREHKIDSEKIFKIKAIDNSIIIRIGGKWKNETGSCGTFELCSTNSPKNIGDFTDYERNTEFDNHFHDCDEFWILYEGSGEVVTEGDRYQVGAGDCVFTSAGDHHDFPTVFETIKGAWFETSLIGKRRKGHLWDHTHSNHYQES